MSLTNITSNNMFEIIGEEFRKSEGYNKYLLWAIIANVPLPQIFIPYATQAFTIILVSFYLKYLPKEKQASPSSKKYIFGIPLSVFGTTVITLLFQLIWIPYVSQLISLIFLSLLFGLSRKTVKL